MAKNKKLTEFENSNTTPMVNIPELREWFDRSYSTIHKTKDKENGRKIFNDINKILRNNKKFLIEKLGKQDFCTKDSSNRRLYCWKFDVEEFGSFWIFTAPERDTSIEVAFEESQKDSFIRLFQNKVREIFELLFI